MKNQDTDCDRLERDSFGLFSRGPDKSFAPHWIFQDSTILVIQRNAFMFRGGTIGSLLLQQEDI